MDRDAAGRLVAITKPYRVVARLKNNRLWTAITMTFPDVKTQSEAARRLDVTPMLLGTLLNMKWWPWNAYRSRWSQAAERIAASLRETPEHLFDAELYGRKPQQIDIEIDLPALTESGLLALPKRPDDRLIERETAELLKAEINRLSERQQEVIRLRFGLEDGIGRTLEEVADAITPYGKRYISSTRVQQIEAKALRKLRHPAGRARIQGEPVRSRPRRVEEQTRLRARLAAASFRPVHKKTEPKKPTPTMVVDEGWSQMCPGTGETTTRVADGDSFREGECPRCHHPRLPLTRDWTLRPHIGARLLPLP